MYMRRHALFSFSISSPVGKEFTNQLPITGEEKRPVGHNQQRMDIATVCTTDIAGLSQFKERQSFGTGKQSILIALGIITRKKPS